MCAGSYLAICAAKKYNHISLILYARGANVNWSKPRICFVIQSVYHYILCHYWKKTKINTKYRFCKSDVRKILPDECTTIQSAFCQNRRIFRQGKSPPFIGEKRRRRQGMEANGGQTAILDRRRGSGKERGKYYEAGNGEKSNRAICQISPVGEGMRCAVPGGGVLENAPTAEKPPTGRFFWVLLIGRLLGTFSLIKALAETREIELCSISCRATQR